MIIESIIGVVAHEAGHVIATLARGLKVRGIVISWKRIAVQAEAGKPADWIWIAAAGPAVNLLLAAAFWRFTAFAEMNILLAVLSLIPIPGSDGQRIMKAVFCRKLERLGFSPIAWR